MDFVLLRGFMANWAFRAVLKITAIYGYSILLFGGLFNIYMGITNTNLEFLYRPTYKREICQFLL